MMDYFEFSLCWILITKELMTSRIFSRLTKSAIQSNKVGWLSGLSVRSGSVCFLALWVQETMSPLVFFKVLYHIPKAANLRPGTSKLHKNTTKVTLCCVLIFKTE